MSRIERDLRATAAHPAAAGPSPDLLDATLARAEREGLVDVAYGQADSPFGPLTVAVSERGLLLVSYPEHPLDEVLDRLARAVSPRVLASPRRVDPVRRELDEYFAGDRRAFDTPLDWALVRGAFFAEVLRACAAIPYGDTSTYRRIAERAGNPRAVRAAGNGLGSNPIPIVVPCHRVLATGGGMGGYTGGIERKRLLLALERGETGMAV